MFCSKCGCKIGEAEMICPECGTARSEMEFNGGFWDLVGENRILTEGKPMQAAESTVSGTDKNLKKENLDSAKPERKLLLLGIVSVLFISVLAFGLYQTNRAARTAEDYNRLKAEYDNLNAGYEELMREYESIAQQYEDLEAFSAANSAHANGAKESAVDSGIPNEQGSPDGREGQESQEGQDGREGQESREGQDNQEVQGG